MAYTYGLLSINYGLLWGIVAYSVRLLGFPGTSFLLLFFWSAQQAVELVCF